MREFEVTLKIKAFGKTDADAIRNAIEHALDNPKECIMHAEAKLIEVNDANKND